MLFPLVLLACSVGGGLLVQELSGRALQGVLVLPVGFALVVAICAFFTSYATLAPAAGGVAVAVAAVGFALALRRRTGGPRKRWSAWLWPALAALVAFAAVGGPALLTGTPTWAGYTRIVDIGFQMDFAKYLADAGRAAPAPDSSYDVMIHKLAIGGYPGGGQATLGAFARLVRSDVPWCYQAFLAFAAAMGALGIFSLLGRITANGPLRALGGAVAIQPNLLYGYTLEAGIKELTTTALLLVLAAVLAERLPGEGRHRGLLPTAVALSATLAAFSAVVVPWIGVMFVGLLVVTLVGKASTFRRTVAGWGLLAAITALLSIPTVIATIKLARGVAKAFGTTAFGGVLELGLGNLAAPVPAWSSAGVWLTGDYRFPLVAHVSATHIADICLIALAVLGIVLAFYRRDWVLGLLGVNAPIALYYWIAHSGPWLEFKAFTITSAVTLLAAFAGACALSRLRWPAARALGWVAALAVAAVVLYGNAITYHDTSLAPAARYHDLAAIGKRYAGQGPTLFPAFDEYAEYFLREERGSDLVNPAYGRFVVAKGVTAPPGGVSFGWDFNQVDPSFLQSFPLLVAPRSPVAPRAPSNYDLVDRTRYFDVWRRDRPADTVIAHYPLSNLPTERAKTGFCRPFLAAVRRAGKNAQVAYAQVAPTTVTGLTLGPHPDYWRSTGPDTVIAYGAGRAEVSVTIPATGRYSMWMQGSIGRPLAVYLDGRRLTSIGYEERYPNQFLLLADVKLRAGSHLLRVVRGGGSLHPGSGDPATDTVERTIGAIVFSQEATDAERVQVAPARDAARVCDAPVGYEWLEILRPGGAPSDALRAATA